MSIDTPPRPASTGSTEPGKQADPIRRSQDWEDLIAGKTKSPKKVFGEACKGGQIYRWGLAVAENPLTIDSEHTPDPVDDSCLSRDSCLPQDERQRDALVGALSRLACDLKTKPRPGASIDWIDRTQQAIENFQSLDVPTPRQAADAVLWSAALPSLLNKLRRQTTTELDCDEGRAPKHLCQQLAITLLDLHEAILQQADATSPLHLMLGGELGLTLTLRLPGIANRRSLIKQSAKAVSRWAKYDDPTIGVTLRQPASARLVLACLIRCRHLYKSLTGKDFSKQTLITGDYLATWVAAMTGHQGQAAFATATGNQVKDDTGVRGLLHAAKQFDRETIGPAMDAALGIRPSGGRLAWEVSLPESMWCDETGKVAVMLPEWDVASGRTHVDFSGQTVAIETHAGGDKLLSGNLRTTLRQNGVPQRPIGDWEEICRYSDDDVHYLEIEQTWSGNLVIQRQFFLIREDQCLMFADAVLQDDNSDPAARLDYQVSLPLRDHVVASEEDETREVFLGVEKTSRKKQRVARRALLMPLAASEWKVGPTSSKLVLDQPGVVWHQQSGRGRLYAPLWMDLDRRRFKRKRTWRQLTVVDSLQLVDKNEAAAFRVQIGSQQWAIYRSLGKPRCRSFLGKHIMTDFYVSRFYMGDGTHDALITVDNQPEDA